MFFRLSSVVGPLSGVPSWKGEFGGALPCPTKYSGCGCDAVTILSCAANGTCVFIWRECCCNVWIDALRVSRRAEFLPEQHPRSYLRTSLEDRGIIPKWSSVSFPPTFLLEYDTIHHKIFKATLFILLMLKAMPHFWSVFSASTNYCAVGTCHVVMPRKQKKVTKTDVLSGRRASKFSL